MMLSNVELVFCGYAEREAPIWFCFVLFFLKAESACSVAFYQE